MLGVQRYGLFVLTGILLNLTPGQDTLFIVGKSLSGGRRAGIAAALGVSAGSLCHTLAAALGLSVVLATSVTAFRVVKWAGAAYLTYLGFRMLLKPMPVAAVPEETAVRSSPSAGFAQGIITNVLNPKVALFFLSFLPQFVSATSPARAASFLLLGATFIATGMTWCLVLAVGAGRFRELAHRYPGIQRLFQQAVGLLFIALGVHLAWASP
jgi:threonine/homoserine/homoserine lactone efflux protein